MQAVVKPLHLLGQLCVFFPQQIAIQLHKLQETFWGGVVEVLLILLVLDTHLLYVVIQSLGILSQMSLMQNTIMYLVNTGMSKGDEVTDGHPHFGLHGI